MPDIIDANFCNNITAIPQFGGTCWFNAILMATLYSKRSRKLILRISKNWDKTNKFLMIIRNILLKYYKKTKESTKFFNKLKPELLLFKMLNSFSDDKLKEEFKKKLKKNGYEDLGWFDDYITTFYKFLGVNVLDITFLRDRDLYLLNFSKYLKYKSNNEGLIFPDVDEYALRSKTYDGEKKEISTIISKVPDVIVLYHSDLGDQSVKNIENIYDHYSKINSNAANAHNLKEFNVSKGNISSYEDTIIFGKATYKLDSCLLGNYDISMLNAQGKQIPGHAIAGISCKKKRFVYNGWNTQTTDLAAGANFVAKNSEACSLMDHNWDVKTNSEFCLNTQQCQLDYLNTYHNRELCFSFNKGKRTLIYVRTDNNDISIDSNLSNISSEYVSDISEIMKDIHDIKKLSDNEIIEKLQKNGIYLAGNFYYTRDMLEHLLLDSLKEYFNESNKSKKKSFKQYKFEKDRQKQIDYEEEKKRKRLDKLKIILPSVNLQSPLPLQPQPLRSPFPLPTPLLLPTLTPTPLPQPARSPFPLPTPLLLPTLTPTPLPIKPKILSASASSSSIKSSYINKMKDENKKIKDKLKKLQQEEEEINKKIQLLKDEREAIERIKKLKLIEKLKQKKEKVLTKAEIIEKIKIKFPNMKNLNAKKKDDLIKILNEEKKVITPPIPKKESERETKKDKEVNIPSLIKKLNNIQKLNYDDLVKELQKYNISLKEHKKYSRSKLEEMLYNEIKKKYLHIKQLDNQPKQKVNKITKTEIIYKIKEKSPNVKKLSTFKKDKLLDIYNFLF